MVKKASFDYSHTQIKAIQMFPRKLFLAAHTKWFDMQFITENSEANFKNKFLTQSETSLKFSV